jgi:hypothetical protein
MCLFQEFGKIVFGRLGVLFYTWVVCMCSLGSLNSNVFSTSRLTQAAGDRQYLPPFLQAGASSAAERHRSPFYGYLSRYLPLRVSSAGDEEDDNVPRWVHPRFFKL